MRIHVFTGSNDAIRDAMATEYARSQAGKNRVENLTEPLKVDPGQLVEIDSMDSLFDDPRVIIFYGSAEPLLKVLPQVSTGGDNLFVLSSSSFAKSKMKGVEAEVTALPPAKNPADLARAYLESIPGFPRSAIARIASHVGKEVNRLPLIVSSLRTQYGTGLDGVTDEDVMKIAGDPSAPAPWDLTDAVDRGDVAGALRIARRLQEGKGSPYGITVILLNHFTMMFRLAQAGVTDERTGAEMLGIKGSTYPVKKAIASARRYGQRLELMVRLVDKAQADLKGGSSLDSATIVDVLVSRVTAR